MNRPKTRFKITVNRCTGDGGIWISVFDYVKHTNNDEKWTLKDRWRHVFIIPYKVLLENE